MLAKLLNIDGNIMPLFEQGKNSTRVEHLIHPLQEHVDDSANKYLT